MFLKPIRTKSPAIALVETVDAREHVKVDHAQDDDYLAGLVGSVTDLLEAPAGLLRVVLHKQTWQQPMAAFPDGAILLPIEPVLNVVSVEYIAAGATTWSTVDPATWESFTDGVGTWVVPVDGATWPDTARRATAARVTFEAGFKANEIPRGIVHAAKLMIGHFYENREASIVGVSAQDLPMGVGALLRPWYRIPV